MCAKHYENPTMLSKVTAKNVGDVFFEIHCTSFLNLEMHWTVVTLTAVLLVLQVSHPLQHTACLYRTQSVTSRPTPNYSWHPLETQSVVHEVTAAIEWGRRIYRLMYRRTACAQAGRPTGHCHSLAGCSNLRRWTPQQAKWVARPSLNNGRASLQWVSRL